jgi:hypothetical protein
MKSKEIKRIEAEERQAEHDKLTTIEKLEKALSRGGGKIGREAKMLYARLAKEMGIKGDYTTSLLAPFVIAKK